MFENRMNVAVEDFAYRLQSQGMSLDLYLKYTNSTMEDFRKTFRPQAEMQVKYRLALEKIVELEKIVADDEAIEKHYEELAKQYGVDIEKVKSAIPKEEIEKDIAVGKAIDLIKENAVLTEKAEGGDTEKKPAAAKKTPAKTAAKKTTAAKSTTAKKTTKKTSDK